MAEPRQFTTQLQAGLGMINETMVLLKTWQPGDTPARLAERATSHGVFARTTARRARNIVVEMFAPRYLADRDQPASRLKALLDSGMPLQDLTQMFFLHTARAQAIFAGFVNDVFWPQYRGGALQLGRQSAEVFIRRAMDVGRTQRRWTEATVRRLSAYLIGCCADFGLLERTSRSSCSIRRFTIRPAVALYLAHDLHFSPLGDSAVISHSDWQLFGIAPEEVLQHFQSLARDGHLIVQVGGDVVQVTWKYRSMEECIRALTER